MSYDYEDELEAARQRRSRRNPSMQSQRTDEGTAEEENLENGWQEAQEQEELFPENLHPEREAVERRLPGDQYHPEILWGQQGQEVLLPV